MKIENKLGRPSRYIKEYKEYAYKLCLLGATDKDLADFFEVDERTINNWKKEHTDFFQSIKKGKKMADMEVAISLYKGATERVVLQQEAIKLKEVFWIDGKRHEKETVQIVILEKTLPADFRNIQFWLKNRQPDKWRDRHEVDHTSDGKVINILSLGDGVNPDIVDD